MDQEQIRPGATKVVGSNVDAVFSGDKAEWLDVGRGSCRHGRRLIDGLHRIIRARRLTPCA
jgi:hypothetical protein